MERKNQKWTEEIRKYLETRRNESSGAIIDDVNKKFGTSFTIHALTAARTAYKLCSFRNSPRPGNAYPIGAEQNRKGYIRVKIAQPDVWRFKHVFIWEKSHGEKVGKNETVIFLDQNNRNFSPDNLYKLTRREMLRMNSKKWFSKDPYETLVHIALVKQRIALVDKAKSLGMCNTDNVLKFESKEYYQRVKNTEHFKEVRKEYAKEYIKTHPEYRARQYAKHRDYMKKYYKEKKECRYLNDLLS